MGKMQQHVIPLSERELRTALAALDYARENGPEWWTRTKYVEQLYLKLRDWSA